MASNGLGYSFAPTFENADEGRRGGSPAVQSQDPLQVLNFRLPKFKGAAGGLSPLQGTTRVGSGIGQAVLESAFQTVLGLDASGLLDGLTGGTTPTPQDAYQPPAPTAAPPPPPPAPSPGNYTSLPWSPGGPTASPAPGDMPNQPPSMGASPQPTMSPRPSQPVPIPQEEPEPAEAFSGGGVITGEDGPFEYYNVPSPFQAPERDAIPEPPQYAAPPAPVIRPGEDERNDVQRPGVGEGTREDVSAPPTFSNPGQFANEEEDALRDLLLRRPLSYKRDAIDTQWLD